MAKGFKEPKMVYSMQYTPDNITLIIQPVHIPVPQHVHYIPPTVASPPLTYVSPHSSFTPKDNHFVPKHNSFVPQGPSINISNRQEVSIIGGSAVDHVISVHPDALSIVRDSSIPVGERMSTLINTLSDSSISAKRQVELYHNVFLDGTLERLEREHADAITQRDDRLKYLDQQIATSLARTKIMETQKESLRLTLETQRENLRREEDKYKEDLSKKTTEVIDRLAAKKAIREKEAIEKKERILNSKEELYEKNLEPREQNAPEVEEYYPLTIQTLIQYSRDYEGFNRQIISLRLAEKVVTCYYFRIHLKN